MKKSFFLILTILPTILLAQSIEIQVVDEISQPMPFAYISINSRTVAVTDTLGYAKVNVSEYSHNDTINVSYISTSGANILIGEVLNKGGHHKFTLPQVFVGLEPIIITASNKRARNKFFRETNITRWLFYNCISQGDFTFAYSNNSDDKYVSGQFKATKFNNAGENWTGFSGPVEVSTSSDTTGLKSLLLSHVLDLVSTSNTMIYSIYSKKQSIVPFYTYLGEFDGIKQYRIVYANFKGGVYVHIIAYIDSKTKDLIAFDCDLTSEMPEHYNKYSISCEVGRFIHKKPTLPKVLVPCSIMHSVVWRDGSKIEIKMDNMVYEYIKPKRN